MLTSALFAAGFSLAQAAGPPTLPTRKVETVAVVDSGEGKGAVVFAVGVGGCKKQRGAAKGDPEDCGIYVELKEGGRGKHRLEWLAKSGTVSQPNANTVVVGGPENDAQLHIRWQPITMGNVNQGAGIHGLVVQQEEHRGSRIRRRYDAFLVRRGKMLHAFTGQEGRGARTWSQLEPADIDHDGGNELVFMTSTTPDEAKADLIEVQIYGWRADVRKLVARNDLRPALKGAVVGMFPSVELAREMQDRPCTERLLVLDQSGADMLTPGQVVLAAPAVTRDDAELALEDLKACNSAMVGGVKTLTGGVDIDVDRE